MFFNQMIGVAHINSRIAYVEYIFMKQRGLTLHHLHAPALLGQEVMSLNTLIGVSNCACAK